MKSHNETNLNINLKSCTKKFFNCVLYSEDFVMKQKMFSDDVFIVSFQRRMVEGMSRTNENISYR